MFLEAIFLGLIEGATEFLPISSTAHLILMSRLLHLPQTEFLHSFEIAIQSGAMVAVILLYWRSFLRREILMRLAVAFIPTGIAGVVLYPLVKSVLLGSLAVVLWSLALGGLAFIIFENWYRKKPAPAEIAVDQLSYRQCVAIGCAQAVAIIPGVSRAGATIVGGLLLGIPRTTIVEFSFLLAVPTMLVATVFDLSRTGFAFSPTQWQSLAVGFLVAAISAAVAIRWLLGFVRSHSFVSFGVYRLLLVAVMLLVLFL